MAGRPYDSMSVSWFRGSTGFGDSSRRQGRCSRGSTSTEKRGPMSRTGADAAAFFAAFDSEIAEWMSTASPLERATVVQELDAALSVDTVESFDDHVSDLLDRYDATSVGSAE